MAQTVAFGSLAAVAAALICYLLYRVIARLGRPPITVSIRLDHQAPGAHLIWTIANPGAAPLTVTQIIVHPKHRLRSVVDTVAFGGPKTIEPDDVLVMTTDVEWPMLEARALAIVDETGREFAVPHAQLSVIQERLHHAIDRRGATASARDFLFGAGDLAVGAVILGLGFFMLMWVIATG